MGAYQAMKKYITNQNSKYSREEIGAEEYSMWKENTTNKLDVFLTCNRITATQYTELMEMLL